MADFEAVSARGETTKLVGKEQHHEWGRKTSHTSDDGGITVLRINIKLGERKHAANAINRPFSIVLRDNFCLGNKYRFVAGTLIANKL